MKINGIDFKIDFTDADLQEKVEKGRKKVIKEIDELLKKEDEIEPAEGIRQECKTIKDFLDYVLGDGTSKKIFGEKDSLELCLKAFEDIMEAKNEQLISMKERISKYSPERIKR